MLNPALSFQSTCTGAEASDNRVMDVALIVTTPAGEPDAVPATWKDQNMRRIVQDAIPSNRFLTKQRQRHAYFCNLCVKFFDAEDTACKHCGSHLGAIAAARLASRSAYLDGQADPVVDARYGANRAIGASFLVWSLDGMVHVRSTRPYALFAGH